MTAPRSGSPRLTAVLCGVFFLSGASALIFETLWFRLAGLAFGNGVWASALVLSSFMAGLAAGNGLAARLGHRIRRPIRLYAAIEALVALSGVGLVAGLPLLPAALGPLLRAFSEHPLALNGLRLASSFVLLMIPATAMGLTLPVLVKALLRAPGDFGRVLGWLYGWNTLGAVAGALLGEVLLLRHFGVLGTGFWAAGFDLLAAAGALAVARRVGERDLPREPSGRVPVSPRARAALFSAALAGGILLALEVVWFRFLQLFLPGTSLTFSVMLAVVLAGIGLGGLAASLAFRLWPRAQRATFLVAIVSGGVSIAVYASFDLVLGAQPERFGSGAFADIARLSAWLMFPTSLLSGVLFSFIGQAVHEELGQGARAAGLVTMYNTIGAALGSIVAGFVAVPRLGMERTFFLLALGYGGVALLNARPATWFARPRRLVEPCFGLLLVGALALFPFGRMQRYIGMPSARFSKDSQVIAVREGLTQTIQYMRRDFLGEPAFYRLVTNSYSMAGTHPLGRRYMKDYVYWPVALHPRLRSAVLISFGTGSTAKALTDTASLETIDVVDISREILEMADVVFPQPGTNPLDDPRVTSHVEDGRFFLQTTPRRFDLITSEPPPPTLAGVVNLYTREYFQLIHERLNEGGITTYWLPCYQLEEPETRAVLRAFVDVFEEASLWTGYGLELMLVGTRGPLAGPLSEEHFAAQWNDPRVAPELRALGFELPEQLGATFLMDADDLRAFTAGTPPVTDNYPKRIAARVEIQWEHYEDYAEYLALEPARQRFRDSAFIARVWPPALRERTLAAFEAQGWLNEIWMATARDRTPGLPLLDLVLRNSELETPVWWLLGSSARQQEIAAARAREGGPPRAQLSQHLGIGALARREYSEAERLFAEADGLRRAPRLLATRVYLLCRAGRQEEARRLVEANRESFAAPDQRALLAWLERSAGL